MDQRERLNDAEEALRLALDGQQAKLWTALPAQIVSVDLTKFTCSAQPLIQGKLTDKNGKVSNTTIPVCPDVPIVFPHGGGFALTFPLAPGDEGLLVFASRCIDNWWSAGGIQPQFEQRMHDLSDGFFIPGPYSQPKKPSSPANANNARWQKQDGSAFFEIAADGTLSASAPSGKTVRTTDTHVLGTLQVDNFSTFNANITVNAAIIGNSLTVGGTTALYRILFASGGVTPGFVGGLSSIGATISVPGAKVGDLAILNLAGAAPSIITDVYIPSPGNVNLNFKNASNTGVVVGSLSYVIAVLGVQP